MYCQVAGWPSDVLVVHICIKAQHQRMECCVCTVPNTAWRDMFHTWHGQHWGMTRKLRETVISSGGCLAGLSVYSNNWAQSNGSIHLIKLFLYTQTSMYTNLFHNKGGVHSYIAAVKTRALCKTKFVLPESPVHSRRMACRIRSMYRNRLIKSRQRLTEARIYSSGDSLCMMRWVSNIMNPQKMMAPATEITNSIASFQKNIWEGRERREGRRGKESIQNKLNLRFWCMGNHQRCLLSRTCSTLAMIKTHSSANKLQRRTKTETERWHHLQPKCLYITATVFQPIYDRSCVACVHAMTGT